MQELVMLATSGSTVEVGSGQLLAAIGTLAGVIWWFVQKSDKGKQAAEKERATITREALAQSEKASDAAVRQAEKASDAAVKTAESIGKLAEAVTGQTEILRLHHDQSTKDHAEICRVMHEKG
jgi:hypothetical protein